jgi:hypothetical protein
VRLMAPDKHLPLGRAGHLLSVVEPSILDCEVVAIWFVGVLRRGSAVGVRVYCMLIICNLRGLPTILILDGERIDVNSTGSTAQIRQMS